ncbi:nitroreductase family protein [Candidatus Woesearchaeota archaeon]|nr:nitroreductase family protein [Candidatus Woesearchaeota archaeon]
MDVHKAVITRRTVRRFLSKPVSHNVVCNILGAACYAPSSGNLQNWRIIVVMDAQKRHDIACVCLEQMWMTTAPVQIVVCNNTVDIERFYGKRGKEVYSIENCAAFIQNVLLLATENGLGSAWVGGFDRHLLQRILKIPDEAVPVAVICIGYAAEEPQSERVALEKVCFFDEWGNASAGFGVFPLEKQFKRLEEKSRNASSRLKSIFSKK